MLSLSPEDRRTYKYLRDLGIFKDVLPHKMPPEQTRKGTILVCCSDGDQFDDVYAHIKQACLEHMPWPRIHPLPRMGGALVIHDGSILSKDRPGYGEDLVEDIFMSHELKNIETLVLYAHAPCGAAARAKLSLAEVLNDLANAKLKLKRTIAKLRLPITVICFVHIDRGQEGKRTYFFPVGQWQLITSRQPVVRGHTWPPENVRVELPASPPAEI